LGKHFVIEEMLAGLKKMQSSMKQLMVVALMFVLMFDSMAVASNQQWAQMNGLWGKRSDPKMNDPMTKPAHYMPTQQDNLYNFMAKRTAQWQNAQGLWGKRSDPQMQQFYYPSFQQYQQPQQA